MALLPSNVSFARQVLPIVAVIGLLAAVAYIAFGQPDRDLSDPTGEPPTAPAALANEARVAGSGVVEPSSELVQVGTALAGLVTDVRVQPGDFVDNGQPLFIVDTRAYEARARETEAAIGEARAALASASGARGGSRSGSDKSRSGWPERMKKAAITSPSTAMTGNIWRVKLMLRMSNATSDPPACVCRHG